MVLLLVGCSGSSKARLDRLLAKSVLEKTASENPGCWLLGPRSFSSMDSFCRTLAFPFPLFLSLFYTNDVERVFSAYTTVSLSLSQLNAFHCASIINVIIISLARFPSLFLSTLHCSVNLSNKGTSP